MAFCKLDPHIFIAGLPHFRAAVFKKLKKFWNEDIERSIKSIRVQQFCRIFTDLLQCTKSALHNTHSSQQYHLTSSTEISRAPIVATFADRFSQCCW